MFECERLRRCQVRLGYRTLITRQSPGRQWTGVSPGATKPRKIGLPPAPPSDVGSDKLRAHRYRYSTNRGHVVCSVARQRPNTPTNRGLGSDAAGGSESTTVSL
jgi:hypothetical protein